MKTPWMKWLLGPVLLVQGYWIRLKTPKLPEPNHPKQGVVGDGPVLRLLLLGDSSAAGVGAETAEQSLLGQLLHHLQQRHRVEYQMLAQTGRTTQDMLRVLQTEPAQAADVVITALGVNDVTSQVSHTTWLNQQRQLISLIKEKHKPQTIIMSGLPPMRDFPALAWPLNAYLGGGADRFDAALQDLCEETGARFHSLRDYPTTAQAATDGFHPGPSVYQIWAQRLSEEISPS